VKTAASTEIGRPVEEVWTFIADPANNPKWDPGTLAVRQTSDGPIRVGTTLVATVELLGRRDLDVRIIGFAPYHFFSFEFLSGPVTGTRVRYDVDAVGVSRTRLTRSFELGLKGAWRVLWPLVVFSARRHRADEVEAVRRLLEPSIARSPT
jgi:Polyketide cyclase / dehydrase and lipid transport